MGVHFTSYYGVDFSGAKLAGRTTWLARLESSAIPLSPAYRLTGLHQLEALCGSAGRTAALDYLVQLIAQSHEALWGLDFPFGLPIEVMDSNLEWTGQLDFVRRWGGDASGIGHEFLRRAKALGGPNHIRRVTDQEAKTPFDCYHYRIIYQTFHGIRDVLGPLAAVPRTAILPFQYRRLPAASRVLVETCPSSTLKRLGLPHQNYKQPTGGPLTPRRRGTRRTILEGLKDKVEIGESHQRVVMRDCGGDALDAVIAAVGAAQSWASADHRMVARHPRYRREGCLFA